MCLLFRVSSGVSMSKFPLAGDKQWNEELLHPEKKGLSDLLFCRLERRGSWVPSEAEAREEN